MSEVPYMPEVVARYFADIVKFTASKVRDRWGHVFEFSDLEQEAWNIALHRWQLWSDQKPLARKDLTIHLNTWVQKQLPAKGWKRIRTEDGKRRWVPTAVTLPYDPQKVSLDLHPLPWAPDDSEDCELRLASDWAPMGRKKRDRFARILMQRYPVLVREFASLEATTKPGNRSHAEWSKRKEAARAKLRVKWARELAEARYAVEGFVAEEAALPPPKSQIHRSPRTRHPGVSVPPAYPVPVARSPRSSMSSFSTCAGALVAVSAVGI